MHRPDKWLRIWTLREQPEMRYEYVYHSVVQVSCDIPYMIM